MLEAGSDVAAPDFGCFIRQLSSIFAEIVRRSIATPARSSDRYAGWRSMTNFASVSRCFSSPSFRRPLGSRRPSGSSGQSGRLAAAATGRSVAGIALQSRSADPTCYDRPGQDRPARPVIATRSAHDTRFGSSKHAEIRRGPCDKRIWQAFSRERVVPDIGDPAARAFHSGERRHQSKAG